jgi:hypothetical protein
MTVFSPGFPVNEPGQPELTRSEVWAGLEEKARNATQFVRAMQSCVVVEEFDGGLIRDIVIRDEAHRERITFDPETTVTFVRIGGPTVGVIRNIIDGDEPDLTLRFIFDVHPKDVPADSPEAAALQNKIAAEYADAIRTTLQTIRRAKSGAATSVSGA